MTIDGQLLRQMLRFLAKKIQKSELGSNGIKIFGNNLNKNLNFNHNTNTLNFNRLNDN